MSGKDIISVEYESCGQESESRLLTGFPRKKVQSVLKSSSPDFEIVVLNTCNRFAVYAFGASQSDLQKWVKVNFGLNKEKSDWTLTTGESSYRLFETVSGICSELLGENEILSQTKSAIREAREFGSSGPVLNELFHHAISVGKRVRTETRISSGVTSITGAGIDAVKEHFDSLSDLTICIVGTGAISKSLLKSIAEDVNKIYLSSHSRMRAYGLALDHKNISPVSIGLIPEILSEIDVLIGCTSQEVLLETDARKCPWEGIKSARMPELIIDFGRPRNFRESLKHEEGTKYLDLDGINRKCNNGFESRKEEVGKVKEIIREENLEYKTVFNNRLAAKYVGPYWDNLLKIKEEEIDWLLPKIGELDERQVELLHRFSHKLIRKISRNTIITAKKALRSPGMYAPDEVAKHMLNIDNR